MTKGAEAPREGGILAGARGADDRSLPSPHPLRLNLQISPVPEGVADARRALERLHLPPEALADAKLLVSELVTNGVRHADLGPEEKILLTAEREGSMLRISVRDRTEGNPPFSTAGSIRPPPRAESGWGLFLVDRLASRWGTGRGPGSSFWFELDLGAGS
jgi:anti-sigma regulatory factor (Ser/Thr protein kinase)